MGKTLPELGKDLYEREEVVARSLLALLSGQSVFLYGPPGTAKSLIARRLSGVLRDSEYFEYLMQRFSTPEELFGPVSISELKKDNYLRKTKNYLPSADIAFLDEIWKASPAILNTRRTISNERKFKNGSEVADVPLKALIAASNEFPAGNSGLDALYDRFMVRLVVNPTADRDSFEKMICASNISETVDISEPITTGDWKYIIDESSKVKVSQEVLEIINEIRRRIAEYLAEDNHTEIYVSDRRWRKAVSLLRTAAFLSGRNRVEPLDAMILTSCLWSSDENKVILDKIVKESVARKCFTDNGESFDERYAELEKEIREIFKHSDEPVEPPIVINDIGCCRTSSRIGYSREETELFVPYGPKSVGGTYNAWDSKNNVHRFQVVSIEGNNLTIRFSENPSETKVVPMNIGTLSYVSDTAVETYGRAVRNFSDDLAKFLGNRKTQISELERNCTSHFVSSEDRDSLLVSMRSKLSDLESKKEYIPVLTGLIHAHKP